MQELWEALTLELGSAFKNQYGDSNGESFAYWTKNLKEFTREQLHQGFVNFKKSGKTYMSLNIFRNHCIPDVDALGLPNFDLAYKALIMAEWGNMPESFRVLFSQHRYELRQLSDAESRKRFKPVYDDAVRRIAQGEQIKIQERLKIENPSGTVHNKKYSGPTGSDAIKLMMRGLK